MSLGALPLRLANLGLPLTTAQAQLIGSIAEWRNQIVHHVPTFDIRAAQQQLPQLLDFIAGYLRTELATPLEKFLPKKLYRVAHRLLSDWQKALKVAQTAAAAEGSALQDSCPRCGAAGVMCLRADGAVHCHLCGAQLYRLDSCDGCGRRTVTSYGISFGEHFCDDCIEAAGDRYIQRQIDLARGK